MKGSSLISDFGLKAHYRPGAAKLFHLRAGFLVVTGATVDVKGLAGDESSVFADQE